jgi:hypothetical protein
LHPGGGWFDTSDPSVPFSGAVPPQAANATHDDKTTPNIETR